MKTIKRLMLLAVLAVAGTLSGSAQYYDLVNQASSMLQTVLRGGSAYRGYIDASYMHGIGSKRADFTEITTTQGIKYNDWFFMGLGLGVDFMHSTYNDTNEYRNEYTQNSVAIPLFTDFRFTIGNQQSTCLFADVRVGAAFWTGNRYILIGDSYINSSESFYLKPTVGVRIPLSKTSNKYSLNIGASYQLLTNSYWYNPGKSRSVTLNSLGASVAFEW